MDILTQIANNKKSEVVLRKSLIPISQLESSVLFNLNTLSLTQKLQSSSSGIIAEHKRRSPSKAIINQNLSVSEVAKSYEDAGACGMSVLTDSKYFGGSLDDLIIARACCKLPILRKEFIIDEYQILEAKAHGTDVILLISAILSKEKIKQFSELAQSLKLEVLLEIHNEAELQKSLMPSINMIGVNNRNLKTFEVSIDTSKRLSSLIPDDFAKVSESGISSVESVIELREYGFQGFLIGEHFMKNDDPQKNTSEFIKKLES